jgi:nucleoside-diphosphate-sugar epimerase
MMIGVTGANGFVGRAVVAHLTQKGHRVRSLLRTCSQAAPDRVVVGHIGANTAWSEALQGLDCVVHCAARVHVMNDAAVDPLAAFREVNRDGSLRLAQQAALAGVRRLLFLSTVKVHGESTRPGQAATAADPVNPQDPYSVSKWEAEQALWTEAARTGLEVVIVRPPLVYGPGVQANMERLRRMVARGLPLPLGGITNRRSLVSLDNLVDLIAVCAEHPQAPGHTFLVSDGEDLSTPALVRAMARAMHRPARLLPIPPSWLRLAGHLTGRSAEIDRLMGSLQIDQAATRARLSWAPPVSVDQGLQRWLGKAGS